MRKTYAIVEDGTVVNITVSEKPLSDNWIESSLARKGDSYDPIGNKFTTPPPAPEPPKRISWDDLPRQAHVKIINDLESRGVITRDEADKVIG